MASSLAMYARRMKKDKERASAADIDTASSAVITTFIEGAVNRAKEQESGRNNMLGRVVYFMVRKTVGMVFKRGGKFIFKHLIVNMARLAVTTVRGLVLLAARSMVRFVMLPAVEAALALAMNPATWAAAAIMGTGYAAWTYLLPNSLKDRIRGYFGVAASKAVDTIEKTYSKTTGKQIYEREKRIKDVTIRDQGANPTGKGFVFREDVEENLERVSREFDIPLHYIRALVKFASGRDPNVGSQTGALGLGQFIRSTWNGFARDYPQYASEGLVPIVDGRPDPRLNIRAMSIAIALYIKGNAAALANQKLDPSDMFNIYLMYNLGNETAFRLLKGSPLSDSDWKKINLQFYNKKDGNTMQYAIARRIEATGADTAAAFLSEWRRRWAGVYNRAGGGYILRERPRSVVDKPVQVPLPKTTEVVETPEEKARQQLQPATAGSSGKAFNLTSTPEMFTLPKTKLILTTH